MHHNSLKCSDLREYNRATHFSMCGSMWWRVRCISISSIDINSIIVLLLVVVVVSVVVLAQLFVVVGCRRWRGRGKDRGELLSLSPTQGDYITCSITEEPSHGFVPKCAEREPKTTTDGA